MWSPTFLAVFLPGCLEDKVWGRGTGHLPLPDFGMISPQILAAERDQPLVSWSCQVHAWQAGAGEMRQRSIAEGFQVLCRKVHIEGSIQAAAVVRHQWNGLNVGSLALPVKGRGCGREVECTRSEPACTTSVIMTATVSLPPFHPSCHCKCVYFPAHLQLWISWWGEEEEEAGSI